MDYIFTTLIGAIGGGIVVYVAVLKWHQVLRRQKRVQDEQAIELRDTKSALHRSRQELMLEQQALQQKQNAFDQKHISYEQLESENAALRTDVHNLDVHSRKVQVDLRHQAERHEAIEEKTQELGGRYLKENVKWISSALTPNNYTQCRQRLVDVIEKCRAIGLDVPKHQEASLVADLKTEFEKAVRAALERERQAQIKATIREDMLREREVQRIIQQAQRERQVVEAALSKALAEAHGQYSDEVEQLKRQLAEAEARAQRTISQAELTKAGHVYVISNIGSFGEGVFKVGLTRRLEPKDRVLELGDASVPFPFDIHMMIASDNAPALENALHRALHKSRLNKVNPRREFFRSDIQSILTVVKDNHGEVEYVADAEALQYRQSLTMPEADGEFIESTYEQFEDELSDEVDVVNRSDLDADETQLPTASA